MRIDDLVSDINQLDVFFDDRKIGTLAFTKDKYVAFSYDEEWVTDGFSISPFSLPVKREVYIPSKRYLEGLFGVFADSLPDSWGRLVIDRYLRSKGVKPDGVNILARSTLVGEQSMGGLTYRPSVTVQETYEIDDLDEIANECQLLLKTDSAPQKLDEIYAAGGSSGGTRPKINMMIDGEEWLIKFPSHVDIADIGDMEQNYAECARHCGIRVSESRLFPSSECNGYFGTKRFDRIGNKRIHMVSAAGLLELDYEQPSLDYTELMKLTKIMTADSEDDVIQMYKLMCFNVYAHNQDDHTKNFAYLYDENKEKWTLAPAYDLTYSTTYYNEHTTSVAGNGKDPGDEEILQVATMAGIQKKKAIKIKDEIKEIVNTELRQYVSENK